MKKPVEYVLMTLEEKIEYMQYIRKVWANMGFMKPTSEWTFEVEHSNSVEYLLKTIPEIVSQTHESAEPAELNGAFYKANKTDIVTVETIGNGSQKSIIRQQANGKTLEYIALVSYTKEYVDFVSGDMIFLLLCNKHNSDYFRPAFHDPVCEGLQREILRFPDKCNCIARKIFKYKTNG